MMMSARLSQQSVRPYKILLHFEPAQADGPFFFFFKSNFIYLLLVHIIIAETIPQRTSMKRILLDT